MYKTTNPHKNNPGSKDSGERLVKGFNITIT